MRDILIEIAYSMVRWLHRTYRVLAQNMHTQHTRTHTIVNANLMCGHL